MSKNEAEGYTVGNTQLACSMVLPREGSWRFRTPAPFAGVIGASLAVFLIQKHTAVNWMLYGAIAFATSITVGYLVSILTGGSRKDLTGLTVWDIKRSG